MYLFLRETWELFYWAMFCPSKLQQRMNEWAPAEEEDGQTPDTSSSDILLGNYNFRFIGQYLLLLLGFSLPLIINIAIKGQGLDWIQLPLVLLTAYGTGFWFLPIGLPIPLIWWLVYLEQPESWIQGLNQALDTLPPLSQIALGLAAGTLALTITCLLILSFLKKNRLDLSRNIFLIGGTFSVCLGSWLATENLLFVLFVSGLTSFWLFIAKDELKTSDDEYDVAVVVAVVVAEVVAGVATLPLPLFILVCLLVAFSLAPAQINGIGITTAAILAALGWENLGLSSFITIPIALVSYYRILPEYLLLTPISLLTSLPLIRRKRLKPRQILRLLPPYTSELLWLPLPNHSRILAATFRDDAATAMTTLEQMQALPLPGFQHTIKQALPQIVADQLARVETVPQLVSIAKPEHPLLSLLVPSFYQSETELENSTQPISSPLIEAEISIMLPRLQTIAKDIEAALEAGNAALRERGLERIWNKLGTLLGQLPGLGLKAPAIKRWRPVIERWQRVIELELEEQQKQSQGELLNPFQYGNPVRLKQNYLFKGRQAFADDIVRRILNRDRPTLVLYGPRRCGKTSFLYNLPRLFPSDLLPVFLDMQSAAVTTSEAAFCQGLVRAIYKDSRSQGIQLPAIPKRKEFQDSPYTTLEDWLDEALPQLGDRRLLLNLDEFEKIGTAINDGRMTLQLFDELRHLIQHYEQLGFLFSGVKTLEEIGPHWSSYFISVVPIEMLYLEPKEAKDLLLDPDPEFTLRYDTGIVKEILRLTRGQPYLLQLLGAAIVTQANLNRTQIVTSNLLQASIKDAFTLGEPYFTNIWTEFTGKSSSEVAVGQELLLALAQNNQPDVDSDEITQAVLGHMHRHHIIEKIDEEYRFEVPLVEIWVRERAVPSSL